MLRFLFGRHVSPHASLNFWSTVLAFACFFALAVLLGRAFGLHCFPDSRVRSAAESQQFLKVPVPDRRGNFYDARGRILATSIEGYSIYVDPKEVKEIEPLAAVLGDILNLDPTGIRERITAKASGRFVWIARSVPVERLRQLRDRMLDSGQDDTLRGTHFRPEPWRSYPLGVGGQILGFVGIDGTGLEGLDATCDEYLRPEPGYVTVMRDVRGRYARHPELAEKPSNPGHDVHLTIDGVIQQIVEAELADVYQATRPVSAWAIVIDPWTGDVLAMASEPSFNPEHFRDYDPADLKRRCRNQVVANLYEVGSVFKPFVIAASLNENLIHMNMVVDCGQGSLQIGKRVLHDHHPYGNLTVTQVLVKSSNVGTARIALKLGQERLYRYVTALGFGQPTGIDFPGEIGGMLRPLREWKPGYSLPSVAIGQEIGTTPIQVAMAFGCLANGGVLLRPRLLRKIVRYDGQEAKAYPVTPIRRVYRRHVVEDLLRPALCGVVTEGTGKAAQVDGYTIAGKTGTAEKVMPGGVKRHMASFVAFGPAQDPRLLVYLGVDEPSGQHFGGQIAAPPVGRILKRCFEYLRIPPALEVKSP